MKKLRTQRLHTASIRKKYERDLALDGYYAIVTNDLMLSPLEVIETYHGLSRIEESRFVIQTKMK